MAPPSAVIRIRIPWAPRGGRVAYRSGRDREAHTPSLFDANSLVRAEAQKVGLLNLNIIPSINQ